MTVIKLTNLGGVYPAVLPRNLPDNGAQVAHNLLARTTEFRPLLTDVAEAAISVANPRVVHKYRNNWLASSAPMSFAVTQVNGDTRERLYYTFDDGSAAPRVVDKTSTGLANLAAAGRLIGVPAPTHAPGAVLAVTNELSVDELPGVADKAQLALKAALDGAFVTAYLGNSIAATEPTYSQLGWLAHGTTPGLPSVSEHQWNLMASMTTKDSGAYMFEDYIALAGMQFLQDPRFGGREVEYGGVKYWVVPVDLHAPVQQIYGPALRDNLLALKNPVDETQFLLDPERTLGTPEIDSIVESAEAYWSPNVPPYKELLDSATAATKRVDAVLKNSTDVVPAAFYSSPAFTDPFGELIGTGDTGIGIERIAFQVNEIATKNRVTGEHEVVKGSASYFSGTDTVPTSGDLHVSAIRADVNASITTNAAGQKTFNADKLRNTLSTKISEVIDLRPVDQRALLRAALGEIVAYCLEPLQRFFSEENLHALGAFTGINYADEFSRAVDEAKAALNRLRDLSTARRDQTADAAKNAYNIGSQSRIAKDAVSRIVDTRFYICTYVNDWGEESAPSPVSAQVEPDQNDWVVITCPIPPVGRSIKGIRIYRSNSGSQSAAFQYLTTIDGGAAKYFATYPDVAAAYAADSLGLTQHEFAEVHYRKFGYAEKHKSPGVLAQESPVADSYWTTVEKRQYTDRMPASNLQEVCPTTTWAEPPANLRGLTNMPNGIVAGFFDNTVCFCEPYTPYAWPVEYQITTEHQIVGMAVFGQTLVVVTEGFPYYISGADSASMSAQKLEMRQACVSAASVVSVDGGVVYASPDGLCMAAGNGISVITAQHFSRTDWQGLAPTTMRCAYHDGVVYFLATGMSSAYALDQATGKLGTVDVAPTAFYSDLKTDRIYGASGTAVSGLFVGTALRTAKWRSKIVVTPAQTGLAWLVAESDFSAPITVRWYGDGGLRHTATLTSRAPVRLPHGRYLEHEIEVESAARLNSITLASSTQELQGVPS